MESFDNCFIPCLYVITSSSIKGSNVEISQISIVANRACLDTRKTAILDALASFRALWSVHSKSLLSPLQLRILLLLQILRRTN